MRRVVMMGWSVGLGLGLMACAASTPELDTPARLIVRGDDMGFSHSGNEALVKCFKEGVETSIEVIVPSPWFPEAVKLLAENPGVDVGVHLAITSEWDNVKWRPMTNAPSLRDENGYFFPMVRPNKNYPGRSISEQKWTLADVEAEFRAQVTTAKRLIPGLTHISGHMGCDSLSDEVRAVVQKIADEHGLVASPRDLGVVGISYKGPHVTTEEKLASFLAMLEELEPGKTYLFVDHPGLDTPELRAVGHIGYENVAQDRQGVTDTWTNPKVREMIRSRNIDLVGYEVLKK